MTTSSERLARVDPPPTTFLHPRAPEVVTLALLLIGALLPGLGLTGWIVGAVLLWLSIRWTVPEKLVATIIWPGGVGGLVWIAESQGIDSVWVPSHADEVWALVGVLGAAAVQLVVLGFLWVSAGRRLDGLS